MALRSRITSNTAYKFASVGERAGKRDKSTGICHVRVPAEGPAVAYGTPWCGKEGLNVNASAPVAGLCFIERAEPGESRIDPLSPAEALTRMMRQAYLPEDAEAAVRTLELHDALLVRAPLWLLYADMSEDAVRVSFEALTGESYDAARAAC